MKECKVIQQTDIKSFENAINNRLNEGYEIISSNMLSTKSNITPYAYYALLVKEC